MTIFPWIGSRGVTPVWCHGDFPEKKRLLDGLNGLDAGDPGACPVKFTTPITEEEARRITKVRLSASWKGLKHLKAVELAAE